MPLRLIICLLLCVIFSSENNANIFYKYAGLKGAVCQRNNETVKIEVLSRKHLVFSQNCTDDLRNLFETMWITKRGRGAIIHLLKTKSKINIYFSDSIGAYKYENDVAFMYAITGPVRKNGFAASITDYDGKPTWKEIRIIICKGAYRFGIRDLKGYKEGKILFINYFGDGEEITGKSRDSLMAKLRHQKEHRDSIYRKQLNEQVVLSEATRRADPKGQSYNYSSLREFYYLTGVHEIEHTRSRNIALSRKNKDSESPAWEIELKARKKLKKVLRSKRISYD